MEAPPRIVARRGLFMVLSIKAAAHAAYYFQASGLEAKRECADGRWIGESDPLGVNDGSAVDAWTFDQLLRRRSAFGASPNFNRSEGSTGRDFVFSAPKSVSLVWAFAPEDSKRAIETAQNDAVKASVELFFAEACRERCGKAGQTLRKAIGVAAAFMHVAARTALHVEKGQVQGDDLSFPDPNLHTHVVVPDIVVSEGGRLKIGYTALHRHWSMALGAWYHATLAYHLRAAGFEICGAGTNGLFDVRGRSNSPDEWRLWTEAVSGFSARTTGPTGAFGRRRPLLQGARPSRGIAKAFERTRAHVLQFDAGTLRDLWDRYATDLGVRDLVRIPRSAKTPTAPNREEKDQLLRCAVEDASATEAVLQRQDLCRGLAAAIVAGDLHMLPNLNLLKLLEDNSKLLERLGPSRAYGFEQWTAKANAEDEFAVRDHAEKLFAARFEPPLMTSKVAAELDALGNDDQRRAARRAISGRGLEIISGPPGTGKTTLLGPVIQAFEAANGAGSVIAAAEAWQPAVAMKRAFGIPAYSLAQLVRDHADRKLHLGPKSVLIIDEAGLLPTKRMREILRLVADRGGKLILVGDDGQLNPIGAGSGMRLVQSVDPAQTDNTSLTKIVRQNDDIQRAIVEDLVSLRLSTSQPSANRASAPEAARRIAAAFVAEKRWASFQTSEDATARIVAEVIDSMSTDDIQPRPVVALARSNREVHHVTRLLRKAMRERQLLVGEDVDVRAVTPMGVTVRLKIAVGDRIRFLVRHRKLGVYNGTCAKVTSTFTGVDAAASAGRKTPSSPRLTVTIEEPSGPRKASFLISEFYDEKGRARIAPAYVATVYGSQGITTDRVVVLKSSFMTFREFYVATTRARSRCDVVEVNATRKFLENVDGGREARVKAIAGDFMSAARSDRLKAIAQDHPRRNELEGSENVRQDAPNNWIFRVLVLDGDEGFKPLNNGRDIPGAHAPKICRTAQRQNIQRGSVYRRT